MGLGDGTVTEPGQHEQVGQLVHGLGLDPERLQGSPEVLVGRLVWQPAEPGGVERGQQAGVGGDDGGAGVGVGEEAVERGDQPVTGGPAIGGTHGRRHRVRRVGGGERRLPAGGDAAVDEHEPVRRPRQQDAGDGRDAVAAGPVGLGGHHLDLARGHAAGVGDRPAEDVDEAVAAVALDPHVADVEAGAGGDVRQRCTRRRR